MGKFNEIIHEDLFYLKEVYKDDKKMLNTMASYVDSHPRIVVDSMLRQVNKMDYNDNEYSDDMRDLLFLILKDICSNEKCSFSDINLISDSGSYSVVFEIGNKVLKLGSERETVYFPNNPYIIKPIIRRYLVDKKSDHKLFIEVVEKANVNSNITVDELYQLYKNVRDLGLVWTDVNYRNVGRLIKDNKLYWKDELIINDKLLHFKKRRDNKVLKANDVVIIDADYIYDENDPNIIVVDNSYYCAFEYQYNIDKKKIIKKRGKKNEN